MPKIGVVLSGCGFYDGAEIQEAVVTLLALDRAGAEVELMAPDIDQLHVVNHLTGNEMSGEIRNVLVESARIVRGNIRNIAEVNADDLDALIFPGGFGVAKNLSDYAMAGPECEVNPYIYDMVVAVRKAEKPIGVMCIAPAMMAKIMGKRGIKVNLTIGSDEKTGADVEIMGAKHVACDVRDIVIDKKHKVVSTPAYMEAKSISEAADGIEKLVTEVTKMI
jgi:enhancing lycopene biosynthesis protein 2